MIAGVGLDLCNVERMKHACESEAFCRKVYTERELAYAAERARRAETLAGMFAAKEAFAKATGLGISRIGLKSVEVVHGPEGKPTLFIAEGCPLPDYLRKSHLFLSISHDAGIAAAVVVIETEGE